MRGSPNVKRAIELDCNTTCNYLVVCPFFTNTVFFTDILGVSQILHISSSLYNIKVIKAFKYAYFRYRATVTL